MVCEANRAGSFDKASKLLQSLAGLPYSPKTVEIMTERVGARLAMERDQATAKFLDPNGHSPGASGEGPKLLVVSLDGGRVQTRQDNPDEKWKEDKVAVVYDAIPCPEKPGTDYRGPSPISRFDSLRSLKAIGP
jgi:hypothetical protein